MNEQVELRYYFVAYNWLNGDAVNQSQCIVCACPTETLYCDIWKAISKTRQASVHLEFVSETTKEDFDAWGKIDFEQYD